ncbi:hypothetical protein [Methyloferula stellata]|uniref:hypothetical protein n=1 Tax=Methyloferula stellata TaxID=876270 RepID=UPI001267A99E|nr:hypothetical protein [Methyloferula stellata]
MRLKEELQDSLRVEIADGSAEAAAANAPARDSGAVPGIARICLTDEDIKLSRSGSILLPATAVFEDLGPLKGNAADPSTWSYEVQEGAFFHAGIVTLAPAIITAKKRCAEVPVEMLLSSLWTQTSQKASDVHVYALADIIDYPVSVQRPAVEFGKLVDDMSVRALLLADISASRKEPTGLRDDDAGRASCLNEAQKFAARIGGGVGRQTSVVVFIGGVAAEEASYGCGFYPRKGADFSAAWSRGARPPAATRELIASAGEYLTGASRAEIGREADACLTAALKPEAQEA